MVCSPDRILYQCSCEIEYWAAKSLSGTGLFDNQVCYVFFVVSASIHQ